MTSDEKHYALFAQSAHFPGGSAIMISGPSTDWEALETEREEAARKADEEGRYSTLYYVSRVQQVTRWEQCP